VNQENQQGKMVDYQTGNQTAKPLKEGKKTQKDKTKNNLQITNSGISILVVLVLLL
jgi:hypothetical protein